MLHTDECQPLAVGTERQVDNRTGGLARHQHSKLVTSAVPAAERMLATTACDPPAIGGQGAERYAVGVVVWVADAFAAGPSECSHRTVLRARQVTKLSVNRVKVTLKSGRGNDTIALGSTLDFELKDRLFGACRLKKIAPLPSVKTRDAAAAYRLRKTICVRLGTSVPAR
jgi:hypothetical protein